MAFKTWMQITNNQIGFMSWRFKKNYLRKSMGVCCRELLQPQNILDLPEN
jgi:hypothetical protein